MEPRFITIAAELGREAAVGEPERIRGELLKLGITVAKHTIQTYIARVCPAKPASQTWATFWKNHAEDIWACDFLPVRNTMGIWLVRGEARSARLAAYSLVTDKWQPLSPAGDKMPKPPYRHVTWDPAGEPVPFVVGSGCLREAQRARGGEDVGVGLDRCAHSFLKLTTVTDLTSGNSRRRCFTFSPTTPSTEIAANASPPCASRAW